jgi:uncharacterized membrane protein
LDENNKKIVITPPTHPMFISIYLIGGIIIALLAFKFPVYIAQSSYLSYAIILGIISAILIILSPALSFVNLIVKTINTGMIENVLELEYVDFFGVPIPVPRVAYREAKMMIAVNLGGAIAPLAISIILFILMTDSPFSHIFYEAVVVSLIINTIATYFLARPIRGVGIAVPAFIPPIIAAISSILIAGLGPAAASAAYISGSMGSLLGADIIHLAKEPEKIFAPLVSIGGAGIFDGVFITGLIAFVLAF